MSFQLKRREKGPPVDCVKARTCGATSIYGFEVQNTHTNCWYAVCVDCARTMAEAGGEYMLNPNEFAEAIAKGGE
tara:strand:- start:878 stop:1102 length:225 start_codon:yes stop_codon:yes gene_type:complete